VYDTTSLPYDRGVHVHARKVVGGKKEIDETYRTIILVDDVPGRTRTNFAISELDAIYYMTSSVFGRTMRYVECTLCGYPHLDRDWFSLHAHRRHLCAACGRQFRDIEIGIGNPLIRISEIFGFNRHKIKKARKRIQINQAKYPGGIQIWGSNPAFLWTDSSRSEEEGIHIHIVSDNGSDVEVDETYAQVEIDGERLDPGMVRVLMAQMALPHISGRVIDIRCPKCGEAHFDGGDLAVIPHEIHTCDHCGFKFRSKGRLRKTIGNPILGTLSRLSETAIRAPQERPVYLIPETL
jgi:DNA-directed RNA polymerase subunit RPC12/RpoP